MKSCSKSLLTSDLLFIEHIVKISYLATCSIATTY